MNRSNLPPTASRALPGEDGRLHAPAADRNAKAILSVLKDHAPRAGRALELASGTGEHAARFAKALPDLTWHPTDIDPARLASIAAWRRHAACTNLAPPQALDATAPGWGAAHPGYALVVAINLLHLITTAQAATLMSQAHQALAPGGKLMLYGPFLRNGAPTSAGDRAFDAQLRAADPEIGYKDDIWTEQVLQESGFDHVARLEMPANNLVFLAERA